MDTLQHLLASEGLTAAASAVSSVIASTDPKKPVDSRAPTAAVATESRKRPADAAPEGERQPKRTDTNKSKRMELATEAARQLNKKLEFYAAMIPLDKMTALAFTCIEKCTTPNHINALVGIFSQEVPDFSVFLGEKCPAIFAPFMAAFFNDIVRYVHACCQYVGRHERLPAKPESPEVEAQLKNLLIAANMVMDGAPSTRRTINAFFFLLDVQCPNDTLTAIHSA